MNINHLMLATFAALILIATGCTQSDEVVNVYSGRHYQTDEKLFKEFTEETGIKVNLVKANSDQLINRLEMEGKRSPADMMIAADAGRLIKARDKDLLQPIVSEKALRIVPPHLRDNENYWLGFTKRARVIIYPKERIRPSDLSTYEALTEEKWQDRLLVRSSQNNYNQTLLASIIAAHGTEKATSWASGIVKNMARSPVGNDRDQIKGIAAGEGDLAIANTYYIGQMLNSASQEERKVARQMEIFFPNQDGRGAHMNISGIGITAHAKNYDNAVLLTEFLLNKKAQRAFAEENHEYPVNEEVKLPALLKTWGDYKPDTLSLHRLGKHLEQAMIAFDNAGWE